MKKWSALAALLVTLGAAGGSAEGGTSQTPDADAPNDVARRAQVCVHVGSRDITVGEVEDRMAQVPPFQLRTFGANADEIRRNFVAQVIVPDALWAQGASARHLDTQIPTRFDLDRVRAQATLRAIKNRLGAPESVPMSEVQAFYDAHKARYDAPERIQIWRISCATQQEARSVLDEIKKDPTIAHWDKLTREHSLDKATYLRSGNIGFVAMDGTSNETGVRIDPAIPKAASAVRDGELVPTPVAEGTGFAVVWRRGTVGASHHTVDDVKSQIQWSILRQKEEDEKKKLLDELRKTNLKEENPEILSGIDVAPPDGVIVPRKRPGEIAPGASK